MTEARATTLFLVASALSMLLVLNQEGPNYEQTKKWIVSKITDEAGSTHSNPSQGHQTTSYEQVSLDDCKLQFTGVLYDSMLDQTMSDVTSVPLDKVSSVSVSHLVFQEIIDEYRVRISTADKVITIKRSQKGGNSVQDQKVLNMDQTAIVFGRSKATNEDMANRMQKALNHAVGLCAKSTTKEPF